MMNIIMHHKHGIRQNVKAVCCRGWGGREDIMAAEQTGRKARVMELDPHYCDVIIKRWEDLTGRKAEKVVG